MRLLSPQSWYLCSFDEDHRTVAEWKGRETPIALTMNPFLRILSNGVLIFAHLFRVSSLLIFVARESSVLPDAECQFDRHTFIPQGISYCVPRERTPCQADYDFFVVCSPTWTCLGLFEADPDILMNVVGPLRLVLRVSLNLSFTDDRGLRC